MILRRSEQFDIDLKQRFRWYLLDTGLDPIPALDLAERFAGVVTRTLDALLQNPQMGRPRFVTFSHLPGIRSWRLEKPFHRFLIFYRVEGSVIFVERLLEGHRCLAGGQ
jgi:plasmid stabilization system protein ParE